MSDVDLVSGIGTLVLEILAVLVIWIACGIGAAVVARKRKADGCIWLLIGMLLGPIGLALSFKAGRKNEP